MKGDTKGADLLYQDAVADNESLFQPSQPDAPADLPDENGKPQRPSAQVGDSVGVSVSAHADVGPRDIRMTGKVKKVDDNGDVIVDLGVDGLRNVRRPADSVSVQRRIQSKPKPSGAVGRVLTNDLNNLGDDEVVQIYRKTNDRHTRKRARLILDKRGVSYKKLQPLKRKPGGFQKGDVIDDGSITTDDLKKREQKTARELESVGATLTAKKESGSFYYKLPDGTPIRISDHEPTDATQAWLDRNDGDSFRYDKPASPDLFNRRLDSFISGLKDEAAAQSQTVRAYQSSLGIPSRASRASEADPENTKSPLLKLEAKTQLETPDSRLRPQNSTKEREPSPGLTTRKGIDSYITTMPSSVPGGYDLVPDAFAADILNTDSSSAKVDSVVVSRFFCLLASERVSCESIVPDRAILWDVNGSIPALII